MRSPSFGTLALCVGVSAAQFCPTLHADFLRRQAAAPFNSLGPYNETHGSKHVPYISFNGTKAVVTVGDGNPYHPMTASADPSEVHFITHIYVLDQNGEIVAMSMLNPTREDIAQIQFDVPLGATTLQAFEWCNKHGLWKGPKVNVTAGESSRTCTKGDMAETAQSAFVADLEFRQDASFNSATPFNQTHGLKHVPFITLNGTTASVTVGDGKPFHPMVASSDPAAVHFITHIYVHDQEGNVIFMQNLDPSGVDKASVSFNVPSNVSSLTAYEFCNKHGLWKGPTVFINVQTSKSENSSILSSMIIVIASSLLAVVLLVVCVVRRILQARGDCDKSDQSGAAQVSV